LHKSAERQALLESKIVRVCDHETAEQKKHINREVKMPWAERAKRGSRVARHHGKGTQTPERVKRYKTAFSGGHC
jgi:hypothetical protein